MAGHMGAKRVTVQTLEVVATDVERGLILIRGGVPGPEGGGILVADAKKRVLPDGVPFPGSVHQAAAPESADAPVPSEASDAAEADKG